MLKSYCAITRLVPLPAVTSYHNQPEVMADCWCGPMERKIKSLVMIKYIAIEFVQAQQIGLKANIILGTKWVDGTVRKSSNDDPTRVADWVVRSAQV